MPVATITPLVGQEIPRRDDRDTRYVFQIMPLDSERGHLLRVTRWRYTTETAASWGERTDKLGFTGGESICTPGRVRISIGLSFSREVQSLLCVVQGNVWEESHKNELGILALGQI